MKEARARSSFRRVLTVIVVTVAVGYSTVCVGMFSLARKLIFPAPSARAWPAYAHGTRLTVPSTTGDVLAWHMPAPSGGNTLLYFHGNGECLADAIPLGAWAHEHGLGLFAVEYPGYAGAPGAPSERSILGAAQAASSYLRDTLKVDRDHTVLLGRSLGTGPATWLASENAGARLVLLSPYTSLPEIGARAFPYLPVRLLMLDRFDSLALAPRIQVPTLVMHGDADEVIPVELGRQLAHAIAGAQYVEVHRAGHNDLPDRPEVLAALDAFGNDRPVPR